jgi:hypothetical protein
MAFLLCCRLGYVCAGRSGAIANHRVSDHEEQRCHALASESLALLGHAWCFSSDDNENGIAGLVEGSVKASPRSSRAEPNTDVNARWIEIPSQPFHAGNELTEQIRHQVVCEWLLSRLIDKLAPRLTAPPAGTPLHVELNLQSTLKLADVRTRLQDLTVARLPALRVTIETGEGPSSLFRTDAWHDCMTPQVARLLVAIQLRNAVSERLQDGVAETGVALLVGRPSIVQRMTAIPSPPSLHRPAIGSSDTVDKTLELAVRWGRTEPARIKTTWAHAVSEALAGTAKSSPQFDEQTQWIDLESTVGDCAGAGAWLATVLAAENAALTGDAQLVLTQEGNDLIALVCRKQT